MFYNIPVLVTVSACLVSLHFGFNIQKEDGYPCCSPAPPRAEGINWSTVHHTPPAEVELHLASVLFYENLVGVIFKTFLPCWFRPALNLLWLQWSHSAQSLLYGWISPPVTKLPSSSARASFTLIILLLFGSTPPKLHRGSVSSRGPHRAPSQLVVDLPPSWTNTPLGMPRTSIPLVLTSSSFPPAPLWSLHPLDMLWPACRSGSCIKASSVPLGLCLLSFA